MRQSRARTISYAAAVLLAAVLLYYSVRGIDWQQVGATLRRANLGRLLLGVVLAGAVAWALSKGFRVH